MERIPGHASVKAQWRHLLHNEFEIVAPLLQPMPEPADVYPRLDGSGRYYDVIRHRDDDIVGICEDDGDRIPLKPLDLLIYRLDTNRLMAKLAAALGLDCESTRVEGLHATYRVGILRPMAGFAFPTFLTVPLEPTEYKGVVESLLATASVPFILLAPTNHHHRITTKQLLDARGCLFLALTDTILQESNHWSLSVAARAALDAFTARVLPRADGTPVVFPTPVGATWSMLRIRFLDGHQVQVQIGSLTRALSYTQMGMAKKSNGNPTVQWNLLHIFAKECGRLTWNSKDAQRKHQKRKDLLAADLKRFFRIEGEPFRYLPDEKGWQAEFQIADAN